MFLSLGEHVPPILVETPIKLSIHTQMKKKSIRGRRDVAAAAIHKRGNKEKKLKVIMYIYETVKGKNIGKYFKSGKNKTKH